MKLTKLMFCIAHGAAAETVRVARDVFGLDGLGNMRAFDYIHNGVWFNRAGHKLGWGDLDPLDLWMISQKLERGDYRGRVDDQPRYGPDDIFVILHESQGHALQGLRGADENEYDVEYVIKHAAWVVLPGFIANVYDDGEGGAHSGMIKCSRTGITAEVFVLGKPRSWLRKQMLAQ